MNLKRIAAAVLIIGLAPWLPAQAAELRPFVRGTLADIEATNAGKPVLVNFWSITCAPCLKEMPLWRVVMDHHPDVEVVLVSTDSFDDAGRILRILSENRLDDIDSWVFADTHKTRLRFDIDRTWQGEMPRTYLLRGDGTREGRSGMLSHEDIVAWLGEP